jgi:hypothetical protein
MMQTYPVFSPSPLAGEGLWRGGRTEALALVPLSPSPSRQGGGEQHDRPPFGLSPSKHPLSNRSG